DGVTWEKPDLGLVEFKGSKRNNALPGLNIFMPVIPNPDGGAARFVGYTPGKGERWSSADGIQWQKQSSTCKLLGKQPKWFVYNSVLHDPDAPPARRWRAYGCMCPNEPPVRRTIAYAYSADGVNFTGPVENPIFQAETGGHWAKVHDVSVSKFKGHYVMIYQTGDGYEQHLELAVSRDGENFTRVHDGKALIPQGAGDAWDRGLHMPSRPVVLDNEIRLYYGGADYQAPGDPFDYERWKMCRMGMGLATLPLDGWAHVRNDTGRNVGYLTTVPIEVEDLRDCVLSVNADVDEDHYLLAELLHADSRDRIPGYELENCDKLVQGGPDHHFSWKGQAGLGGVTAKRFRVRVIFRGKGETPNLRSIGFRRVAGSVAPVTAKAGGELVEGAMVYRSSVSRIAPLKAWITYRPDGKPKPMVVTMHSYGDPVLRHGGHRMAGTGRSYASKGLFAIAVDMRGREESVGQRDDGGVEVMDIYDAVQAALAQYPLETDPANINIIGWSGGGGNTFSAVTRMPDLFSNASAFYGITDYGYWASTTWRGTIQPNVGGEVDAVPDRYMARNSLLGVLNNRYTRFQFFWDEEEVLCPPWMDEEYRRITQELGYTNIIAHESYTNQADVVRWKHTGGFNATALTDPPMFERNNPAPQLDRDGRLVVLGYLMTKPFRVFFGHGNDAAAEVAYRLAPETYHFAFKPLSSDPDVRGWLRVTDRPTEAVVRVGSKRGDLAWEVTADGHALIRDIRLDDEIEICFK
ncbi:MAG: prolyl oligopeptidase family serine peptidase, partial [Kiritimatiellae bacterium]|nr:prolyl oligopeptidase family serine peptidase [Kiritimatiellia bacterium]